MTFLSVLSALLFYGKLIGTINLSFLVCSIPLMVEIVLSTILALLKAVSEEREGNQNG